MATSDPSTPGARRAPGVRRPTSADVARATGLSRATVSYVLNDTPHQAIPERTRARVLEAAAALGYTPSAAARALRSGRSDVVLCLLPDWPIGTTVGVLMQGLSTALARAGLTFVAHPRSPADRPVAELWRSITPAAVITFEAVPPEEVAQMAKAGVAVTMALLGGAGGVGGGHALQVPEQRSGRLQVEHLASRGHRHLGYAYPEDPRVAGFAEHRLIGVRLACAELGLDPPVVVPMRIDVASARAAVAAWRAASPAVTAVCAYNDEAALAVLAGAREVGVRVPDDLAVIGIDNLPAAALAMPALTTVAVDVRAMAEHLAAGVVADLAGRPLPPGTGSDIHEVIVRASA